LRPQNYLNALLSVASNLVLFHKKDEQRPSALVGRQFTSLQLEKSGIESLALHLFVGVVYRCEKNIKPGRRLDMQLIIPEYDAKNGRDVSCSLKDSVP
jgi:hypothetical protein